VRNTLIYFPVHGEIGIGSESVMACVGLAFDSALTSSTLPVIQWFSGNTMMQNSGISKKTNYSNAGFLEKNLYLGNPLLKAFKEVLSNYADHRFFFKKDFAKISTRPSKNTKKSKNLRKAGTKRPLLQCEGETVNQYTKKSVRTVVRRCSRCLKQKY